MQTWVSNTQVAATCHDMFTLGQGMDHPVTLSFLYTDLLVCSLKQWNTDCLPSRRYSVILFQLTGSIIVDLYEWYCICDLLGPCNLRGLGTRFVSV